MIIPFVGIAAETTGSHKISRRNTIPRTNIDLEAQKKGKVVFQPQIIQIHGRAHLITKLCPI